MSNLKDLLSPIDLNGFQLKNRVVMSALTRNRNLVPGKVNIDYYTQRASAGLLVTEGTLIEPQGTEWPEAPGIWSQEQIQAWKKVTDSVHANEGKIFCQIWHLGRIAHTLHNAGVPPPAPSAIKAEGGKYRLLKEDSGHSIPKPIEDPKYYIQMHKQAAINAKEAGFDGVELHSSNGYLVHQFLESHSNKRTDNYGGSIENRTRFGLEIIDAFIEVFGANRVGIKISPCGGYNDMGEKTEEEIFNLYSHYVKELDSRNVAYITIVRHLPSFDPTNRGLKFDVLKLVPLIKNSKVLLNGDFTAEEANAFIAEGKVDGIVFGRPFIANPDLVERFTNGKELSQITDYSVLYNYPGEDKHFGYSDFPAST